MKKPPAFAGIWREDERARAAYAEGAGIYRMIPAAVALPSTTRALCQLVRWAADAGVPLVPRGAGSAMPGSNVGSGVIVDLGALDGAPIAIDAERSIARTGAAATLGDLAEQAARHGLRMPVDPSSARWATVGGAVSTNAAGARSVKYGSVRGWVQAVHLVTSDGEPILLERGRPVPSSALARRLLEVEPTLRLARWRVESTFPKVRKNTAGYALDAYLASGDVLDLIIGSEGTLGVVTGVAWRLEPVPAVRVGVRAAIRDVRRLGRLAPALLSLEPSRFELLDGTFLGFVAEEAAASLVRLADITREGALLMIELEGASVKELAPAVERAVGLLRPESVEVLVAHDARELDTLWAIRHAASPRLARLGPARRSLQVIEDACVPLERLGDYIGVVREAARRRQLDVVMFGHAGDGHVHANLLPDVGQADWLERVRGVFAEVTRAVLEMGGSPSGEHGDGRLRAPVVERVYGWETTQLFRQIKRAFDPAGVLNPGVKLGPEADVLADLKVGEDAVPLPADVARGLRWIEANAGYSTGRLSLADDPSGWSVPADAQLA